MLLKRNVFRVVCALFYLPVALLSMFEIINLVMTNSQNRYFLVGGVVFGVLLFLIAAYFIKQKKWLIIAENSRPISIILETIIVVLVGVGLFLWQNLVYGWKTAATSLVLTLCIYAIGRLCSGRICGIISFAKQMKVPYRTYAAQELEQQAGTFTASSFVKGQMGVDNVCERSACAASGGGEKIVAKTACDGITVAVYKIKEFTFGRE